MNCGCFLFELVPFIAKGNVFPFDLAGLTIIVTLTIFVNLSHSRHFLVSWEYVASGDDVILTEYFLSTMIWVDSTLINGVDIDVGLKFGFRFNKLNLVI
jgi:hypothetical protein